MNYQKITEIRDNIYAQVEKVVKRQQENSKNIECEVLSSSDENKQKYAYLHFKDYGYEGDFEAFCDSIKEIVGKKYKNAILARDSDGDRKMLIFVPQDKKVKTLVEDGFDYNNLVNQEATSIKVKRKVKI